MARHSEPIGVEPSSQGSSVLSLHAIESSVSSSRPDTRLVDQATADWAHDVLQPSCHLNGARRLMVSPGALSQWGGS